LLELLLSNDFLIEENEVVIIEYVTKKMVVEDSFQTDSDDSSSKDS